MSGVIGVVILVVLSLVLGFLTSLAWRIRRLLLRIPVMVVTALVTLIFGALSVVGLIGLYRLDAPHGSAAAAIHVPQMSAAQMSEGQRRANVCASCHSTTGQVPLDGGAHNLIGPDPGQPGNGLGTLVAPNLTPDGPLKDWTDGQIIRAIREGVDNNGHPLMIMPSDSFHHFSDADVQELVAYLRSQPGVQHDTPTRNVSIIGVLLVGAGLFPTSVQPPVTQPVTAPPPGVTADYGNYLVDVTGCRTCHGQALTGLVPNGQGPPAGPNLTYIVPKWTDAQFIQTIRSGVDPTGHNLSDEMPWKEFAAAYSDDELSAIYTYLHGLPATAGPNG